MLSVTKHKTLYGSNCSASSWRTRCGCPQILFLNAKVSLGNVKSSFNMNFKLKIASAQFSRRSARYRSGECQTPRCSSPATRQCTRELLEHDVQHFLELILHTGLQFMPYFVRCKFSSKNCSFWYHVILSWSYAQWYACLETKVKSIFSNLNSKVLPLIFQKRISLILKNSSRWISKTHVVIFDPPLSNAPYVISHRICMYIYSRIFPKWFALSSLFTIWELHRLY